tara:strand:- start:879 stop:1481 length:603 start_codon:yes stop_codon:yes gene_type:complete
MKIYNQDCLEAMKDMSDNQFDLAIVDPPYGIDVTKMNMGGRKRNETDKKKNWDNSIPNKEYFKELFRVTKNQIIWGGNYFKLPCSQYFCIWDKGETMYGRSFAEAEYAWVSKGGTRIYKKNPNQLDRIHPTQKPVALYEWLLMNYAKEGDKILDTHLGSGSIAIACHNLGYDLTGYEIDKDYYNSAIKRIEQHKSQIRMF